ncbi:hypothetical protein G7Y89_g14735 [Cudoniella acicularis]|uniref:Aminoglycoside phosphotransferase domain-containing protein n=1 Tax=Cudoniella acicularis TaxID=354080 RepID=A0A8H4R0D0_9HELO|nr:hypothetical protein G7Y89_g14735 [Cudoniella acicularis]
MSQDHTFPLIRGKTTLADALEQEENMLLDLAYPEQRIDFFVSLYSRRKDIVKLVEYHLGLTNPNAGTCRLGEVKEWIHGSFNVCIPVYVDKWKKHPGRRVLIRFPLPYKIGESKYPGNADEKLRCEAATYIWIRENCPDVPIPHLWGFGLPGGKSFLEPQTVPLISRLVWRLERTISSLFGHPLPCQYITRQREYISDNGYLVVDFIEGNDVKMLSETWDEGLQVPDHTKRSNLFKGLSLILLSLSRIPLPRIGSWTMDSDGVLQLTNRPLTLGLHQFENQGIPTDIDRSLTYSASESYYLDILSYHNNRLRYQPNSLNDEKDGRAQMANLITMRGLLSHFTDRNLRQGPFFLQLTDLHQSNIFVDEHWNIHCLIDLEWACSLPAEMLRPPYWLTGESIDTLTDKRLEEFDQVRQKFMQIFEEEERSSCSGNSVNTFRTDIMRKGWAKGNFWFFGALESPKGLYNIFRDHIQAIFAPPEDLFEFRRIMSEYWAPDVKNIIEQKLHDKEMYERTLREMFENNKNKNPT